MNKRTRNNRIKTNLFYNTKNKIRINLMNLMNKYSNTNFLKEHESTIYGRNYHDELIITCF